ncbi:MAG TPA: copper chaperone PCu(A)C [Paracoccaceae bacterium]|nr:copper chaperone PCu(A)C [Paracoccaceae bacterium]
MLSLLRATLAVALLAVPAAAQSHDGMHVTDAYARVSGPSAQSGAVFLMLENHGTAEDRLIGVASDVAARVEMHTHTQDANGVMQMREVPEGFAIAAGGTHALARGGDHIMLLGLTRPLNQGDSFPLTLTFQRGEVITLDVTVDAQRPAPAMGHGAGHMHGAAPSN